MHYEFLTVHSQPITMLRNLLKSRKRNRSIDRNLHRRLQFLRGVEQLEPRIVLDAGMASLAIDLLVSDPSGALEGDTDIDIVLVNEQLAFSQELLEATTSDAVSVAYDGNGFDTEMLVRLLVDTLQREQATSIARYTSTENGSKNS